MRRLCAALLLLAACRSAESPFARDARLIAEAIRTNDCRLVDDVFFVPLDVPESDWQFVWDCWEQRQQELIPPAMARNDCESVMRLPGIYPKGTDAERRFVYHCWMEAGKGDLDTCIGMMEVGDASSREHIIAVLKRNAPERVPDGVPGSRFAMIDTAHACMSALRQIDGLSEAELRRVAVTWGGTWKEWAEAAP